VWIMHEEDLLNSVGLAPVVEEVGNFSTVKSGELGSSVNWG